MTLRGSIAEFPLETIVQLLAATAKTGQLEIRSASELGSLGFAEGRLVSAASGDDGGDSALGAVFALSDGEFEFIGWNEAPPANLSGDLNELLDRAVVQRDKIASDRAIIADDRLRFALSDRAAASGEVRLSADQWKALLAVNGERDVNGVAAHLGTGRFATLAMLADLVRAGIVELREAPAEPEPPTTGSTARDERADAPAAPDAQVAADPARSWAAPVAPTEPEPRSWVAPVAPAEPEPRSWDRPAEPERPAWESPAESERPAWDRPAEPERPAWDRPAEPERPTWESPAESERPSWDGPAETARDRGTPAAPDAPAAGPRSWGDADREPAAAPQTESAPPAMDERLAALSSLPDEPSGPVAGRPSGVAAPPAEPPAAEAGAAEPPAKAVERPAVEAPSELPADAPRRKGGLFAGLFKRDEPAPASREAGMAPGAESRVATLAALANGLLDEYGNGEYGKGRIDDRMANLLLRADEQAEPIDRALPVSGDRIDVAALEHAGLNDRQVAPYLALLVSQIYEDAERAFGHDRARRGYKSVHQKVVGDAASLGSDLRLPRV